MDEDDQKEGLLKRLKNTENAQKNLIRGDDNKSIYYTPRSEFDSKDDKDKDKKTQQNNYIDTKTTKCLWLFKKFKSRGKRFDGWNRRCKRWHWRQ